MSDIFKDATKGKTVELTFKDTQVIDKGKSKDKSISILDMGSGTGIQAQTCKDLGFQNIITVDINPEAITHLKEQGFKAIKSNLFSNIDSVTKLTASPVVIKATHNACRSVGKPG